MNKFFLYLFFSIIFANFCRAEILISEFMAANDSTLMDGDGNYSDWIELYNPSSNSADIAGYYLTDNTNDLTKWQFPATNISAYGFLIVFASGQNVDNYVDSLGYFHTNFKLSKNDNDEREDVALVLTDGVTIVHAHLSYPPQFNDISYGLAWERTSSVLIPAKQDATALIPTATVPNWAENSFDDSGWLIGKTGVGYEFDSGYGHLINLDVGAMRNINPSFYTRVKFNVSGSGTFDSLTLKLKYDDGFAAYINGVECAITNAPPSPQWNSVATRSHEADTVTYEEFDVSSAVPSLVTGTNVLAIQGLNRPVGSSDILIFPELTAELIGEIETNANVFLTTPTPGKKNSRGSLGFVDTPKFSIERGFFSSPFNLSISNFTENSEIRYSFDGSSPTSTTGTLYTGKLTISNTTILRAGAFKSGFTPSKIITHTYIFVSDVVTQSPNGEVPGPTWPATPVNGQIFDYGMDPDIVNNAEYSNLIDDALLSIPSFSIVTDADNLFNPEYGIYVNAQGDGSDWECPASVELIYPDEKTGFHINAGLRIRGGMSRNPTNPKHSFRIFFRSEYGDAKLYFPLFGDEGVNEFDKLDLRTGQNFSWNIGAGGNSIYSTWLYDIFVRDTHRYMLQPYTRGFFCHVYLNGQYWGLYQTEERPEARYGESYFGSDNEDFDAVKSGDNQGEIEATDGFLDSYNRLWSEINSGMADNSNYFRIQGLNEDESKNQNYIALLDINNLMDYMITVFYSGNRDMPLGPPNSNTQPRNLFAIFNRDNPIGFQFIPHDSEHVLGAHLPQGVNFDRVNYVLNPNLSEQRYCNPWWIHLQLIASNEEYKIRFADRIHKYFFNNGALTSSASTNRFLTRKEEMDLAIIAESARWGDFLFPTNPPYTKNDTWIPAINNILDNYLLASPQTRSDVVLNQFIGRGWYPNISAPAFSQNGGTFTNGFALNMSASYPIYYTIDGTDPRETGTGNPIGILYTNLFKLPYSVNIKARALNGTTWSALNSAVFVLNEEVPLRVTELMYNPADPEHGQTNYTSSDFEFIELQNIGTQTVGLAGIEFTEGIIFQFENGAVSSLDPGEFVVLINDKFGFAERYTNWANINIAGEFHGKFFLPGAFDNSGEKITLTDGRENTIQSFAYKDSWHPSTDGGGYSLTILNPSANTNSWNQSSGWRPSCLIGGTPGYGPSSPLSAGLVINEFMAINDTTITDNFGNYDDWIELYNSDSNSVDLTGMFLSDDLGEPTKWTFPETNLQPTAFLILWADNETNEGLLHLPFKLSGSGEEIGLYSSAISGTALIHSIVFGVQSADISYGIFPDAIGEWSLFSIPTPGTNNILPEPFLIIWIFYFGFRIWMHCH